MRRSALNRPARVVIVDDSSFVRTLLSRQLESVADIEVVGVAADPYEARDAILMLAPDVITLDLEMPRMDGITFLRKLMRYHPVPVVVVSSLTSSGGGVAAAALEAGAVKVVAKPGPSSSVSDVVEEIVSAIRLAAGNRMRPRGNPAAVRSTRFRPGSFIAVGSSIGGPKALETFLSGVPADSPGIVIVQHMPKPFTDALAGRLNELTTIEVREARSGDRIRPGVALLAPGDAHMIVSREDSALMVDIRSGPLVSSHRPSVDVLFRSIARKAGADVVGVLMTGMGSDGARGLHALREAGAHTIIQDSSTCVVFGMGREALELDRKHEELPLNRIAESALRHLAVSRSGHSMAERP